MFKCMGVCMCARTQAHMFTWLWRAKVDLRCLLQLPSDLYIEAGSLSEPSVHQVQLVPLASLLQECPPPCLLHSELAGSCCTHQVFTWVLGIQTRFLMLEHQWLYLLGHLPSPRGRLYVVVWISLESRQGIKLPSSVEPWPPTSS